MEDIDANPCIKCTGNTLKRVVSSEYNKPHILLATGNDEMRSLLADALSRSGYDVIECPDGWNLLNHLSPYIFPDLLHKQFDLLITEIRLPGITGLEILEGLHHCKDFPPRILISSSEPSNPHQEIGNCGASAIFDKTFDMDELLAEVQNIINTRKRHN